MIQVKINQGGFSLLELLVAISVTTILLMIASNFVITGTLSANVEYNRTVVQSNTKSAVENVARTIRSAKSVEATNSQPDPNPPVTANPYSWSATAGNNATLILAVPARDASNNLMYVDGLHSTIYTNDVIFYLDSTTHRLYRRTIANSVADNAAKTSCPPAIASASCPADTIIVEDIAGLSTSYFDAANANVSVPSGTEAVGYSVTETKIIGKRSYSSTYSTVTALRNR